MIQIENLAITLGGNPIVKQINLSASAGNIFCIVGPNGAGKSTFIRTLAGSLPHYRGEVLYQNQNVKLLSHRKRAQVFSYLPQNLQFEAGYTLEAFIKLANVPWENMKQEISVEQRLDHALDICNIAHLRSRRIETLSGGERQRAFLAQVVFQDTPIVLLDEPTTFLDLKHIIQIESVLHKLKEQKKLIFCVTHDVSLTQHLATHVLGLKNGETHFIGKSNEVLTTQNIANLFEVSHKIIQSRYSLNQ